MKHPIEDIVWQAGPNCRHWGLPICSLTELKENWPWMERLHIQPAMCGHGFDLIGNGSEAWITPGLGALLREMKILRYDDERGPYKRGWPEWWIDLYVRRTAEVVGL